MQSNIKLVVIKDALDYAQTEQASHVEHGDDLFLMLNNIYPSNIPPNTRWYLNGWDVNSDVTPEDASDIKKLNEVGGTIYVITYPGDPITAIVTAISIVVSVAVAFLMPMPTVPGSGAPTSPPSPNNALAQRTNRQRLGGRVPAIFGEVWSVPDLVAQTYSVYVNHREVEHAAMVIGIGSFNVIDAYDDTTSLSQIYGSNVQVFNPAVSMSATPSFEFGQYLSTDEMEWAKMIAKRYTSVNGQILPPPDAYIQTNLIFRAPNIIEVTSGIDINSYFAPGKSILVEGADKLTSGNNIHSNGAVVTYNLNGRYLVESVINRQIILANAPQVTKDWSTLANNADFTAESDRTTISTESITMWQGPFYTNQRDHTDFFVNIIAQSLYDGEPTGTWRALRIYGQIESEVVDFDNNVIPGTLHTQQFTIASPDFDRFTARPQGGSRRYDDTHQVTTSNRVRESAGVTIKISNPYFSVGQLLRIRVSRTSKVVEDTSGGISDDIRIKDFFSGRPMNDSDSPDVVTRVFSKSLATEGALALKERKLKCLVQHYVRDWQNNDRLINSKRIDDIIYHIATSETTGGLTTNDLNMTQITTEVDAQIDYFGTDLCAQFCGTFDSTDISTEEMIQTVAGAGFFTAYRINNKIHLHFERQESHSAVSFNSHNITPESFEYAESFGTRDDYDAVEVTYTDPKNDEKLTLMYPAAGGLKVQKFELVGVRNNVQAHMHLMRLYRKNLHSYKTCSFTGADESAIVLPTNRIDVANQTRADTQQGSVVDYVAVSETGKQILTLSEPAIFSDQGVGTLYVQTADAKVESLTVFESNYNAYEVSVGVNNGFNGNISTGHSNVVNATYRFVPKLNIDNDQDSYLVTKKEPGENPFTHRLTCVNYSDKYYQNDKDYLNGNVRLNN